MPNHVSDHGNDAIGTRRSTLRLQGTRAVLAPAHVAAELGVSLSTVYRWVATRKLRVVRIGRGVRIPIQTMDRLARTRLETDKSTVSRPPAPDSGRSIPHAETPVRRATPWSSAYVSFERSRDVPDRCPRPGCRGALRPFGIGVVCATCGRVFVVREHLARSLRR